MQAILHLPLAKLLAELYLYISKFISDLIAFYLLWRFNIVLANLLHAKLVESFAKICTKSETVYEESPEPFMKIFRDELF